MDDLDQQLDQAVSDLMDPQPTVSSEQAEAQGRGMPADLVGVLHGGALPIPLQQSRGNVAEEVRRQVQLSELLQLANLGQRIVEAHLPRVHFQLLNGERSGSAAS